MKQFYKCDVCGELYEKEEKCRECEARHKVEKTEFEKAIQKKDKLKDELRAAMDHQYDILQKYLAACNVVRDLEGKSSFHSPQNFFDFSSIFNF